MTNDRSNGQPTHPESRGSAQDASCDAHDWCTLADPTEHAQYHCGEAVDLAGTDGSGEIGWWAWLTREVGDDAVVIELEGHASPGAPADSVTMDWGTLEMVLEATSTPESHAALLKLARRAGATS